jgi:hypothetical protein
MHSRLRSLAGLGIAVLLAGCGTGVEQTAVPSKVSTAAPQATASVTAQPTPTLDVTHPVGMIAVGHSGLTGEGTAGLHQDNVNDSWATGTDPAVNSIYLRLVATLPSIGSHVSNTARGGASASALVAQVQSALARVPVPELAIVSTIDNDIMCDQSNMAHFGEWVAQGLNEIHTASPNTKILIIGQLGRPSVDYIKRLVAAVPGQKAALTWDDECSFFLDDGTLNGPGIVKLAAAIDAYEAEQARVCVTIPNCSTDGGVRKTWVDKIELFSPDYAHLNARGQAAEAEQMWPVVKALLGL